MDVQEMGGEGLEGAGRDISLLRKSKDWIPDSIEATSTTGGQIIFKGTRPSI